MLLSFNKSDKKQKPPKFLVFQFFTWKIKMPECWQPSRDVPSSRRRTDTHTNRTNFIPSTADAKLAGNKVCISSNWYCPTDSTNLRESSASFCQRRTSVVCHFPKSYKVLHNYVDDFTHSVIVRNQLLFSSMFWVHVVWGCCFSLCGGLWWISFNS